MVCFLHFVQSFFLCHCIWLRFHVCCFWIVGLAPYQSNNQCEQQSRTQPARLFEPTSSRCFSFLIHTCCYLDLYTKTGQNVLTVSCPTPSYKCLKFDATTICVWTRLSRSTVQTLIQRSRLCSDMCHIRQIWLTGEDGRRTSNLLSP